MKINQIASKPQLIKLVIDDKDVVDQFGEPIEFWTWDRQPLETFMKLANVSHTDASAVIDVVKNLILDEEGRVVIQGEVMLPTLVLIRIIEKIVATLGK